MRRVSIDDAWERYDYVAPPSAFGTGSRHEFSWYFEGESTVTATSIDDVQDWLLTCDYEHDPALFNEPDFWQHPRTFERLRRGDCEDHAIWAWRKLVELGYDADLVSGTVFHPEDEIEPRHGHVWVLLRRENETYVFEAAAKSRETMIRPLVELRDRYRPEFGVDRTCRRYTFNGALHALREDRQGSSTPRTA